MKQLIENLIKQSINKFADNTQIDEKVLSNIRIDRTKDRSHGDFATNIAMILSKPLKNNPRAVAQLLVDNLPEDSHISKVEIAGPGFINFFIHNRLSYLLSKK